MVKRLSRLVLPFVALAVAIEVLYAAASYPASVKSFTTKIAGDTVQPAHINDLQDEITAIETEILTSGVTLTSGKISFPATQLASAGVNVLDDYEEGTWVPVIASSGGGTATYTTQAGFYVKVGRRIDFWGRITMATAGTLAAGTITITGLPLAALGTSQFFGGCNFTFYAGLTTAMLELQGTIAAGAQVITLRHLTAASSAGLTTTAFSDLSGTTDLIFYGTYQAAN